jgi:hypothetical protein
MAFGLADLGDVRSKDSRPSTWRLSFCAWTQRLPPQPLLGRIFDIPATTLNLWLGTGKIELRRRHHRGAVFIQDLDSPA